MLNLRNIDRFGIWKESVEDINFNFDTIGEYLESLGNSVQRCKGLFPDYSTLVKMYPKPEKGSWAVVGTNLPGNVWIYNGSSWSVLSGATSGRGDISEYLNSYELAEDEDIRDMFRTKYQWIYNNGSAWRSYTNGIKLTADVDATYILRPKNINYGEAGEILERTLTDAYLYKFKDGYRFVSAVISSSDDITKTFTTGDLSWTIDKTYFKEIIDGRVVSRDPVRGDKIRVITTFEETIDRIPHATSTQFEFIL